MNILVVDDDVVDQEFIQRTLSRSKTFTYDISSAYSVDDGLAMVRDNSYNLILLDYKMPEKDGIELVKSLHRDLQSGNSKDSTAIVMMSSSDNEELAIECIKAGAQDFLVKAEISEPRLRRAMLHAEVRHDLEYQLYQSFTKVKELAEKDSLTGLTNRHSFDEALKREVLNNHRNEFKLALILIDLDGFKYINDTYGHDIGDLLLIRFAERLSGQLRGHETFSRLGGDEFGLLVNHLTSVQDAGIIARRLVHSLEEPIVINGREFEVNISIGIAIHPDNTTTAEQLVKFADIAMYRSKRVGKGQICFFQASMQDEFSSRYRLEKEIVHGLRYEQFAVCFQPIMDTNTLTMSGVEALARWDHPDGMRYPDEFIPIAEESTLINDIGFYVMRHALRAIAEWTQTYQQPLTVSINLSPAQLSNSDFIETLNAICDNYQVAKSQVILELTETLFVSDINTAISRLNALHSQGYKIALDDFGTGFSSISHLQNLPIDIVKIDRSIMSYENKADKTYQLFMGLVSMLKVIGQDIVAEGIEDASKVQACQLLGIQKMQGYYFCKPEPIATIVQKYLVK